VLHVPSFPWTRSIGSYLTGTQTRKYYENKDYCGQHMHVGHVYQNWMV